MQRRVQRADRALHGSINPVVRRRIRQRCSMLTIGTALVRSAACGSDDGGDDAGVHADLGSDQTATSEAGGPPPVRLDAQGLAEEVPDVSSTAADEPGWGTFVVEHYWPGVTPDAFEAVVSTVRAAADHLGRDGLAVRFLHSTLVVDDEAAYCVLSAHTRHAVEAVYEAAGVGFERLLDAVEHPGRSREPE